MIRSTNTTLAEFLREVYLPSRLGLSAGAAEQLAIAVRCLEQCAGFPVGLLDLSESLLTKCLVIYRSSHAAATTNSKRRAILTLWRSAAESGIISPPGKVPRCPEPDRLPEAWTITEVERLLATARGLRGNVGTIPRRFWWSALILAIYDTGERVSSVRSVATADCSLSERYVIVRAENQKTNRDRLFWLSDQTIAALAAIHSPSGSLLFPWPYCSSYLWQYFRRLVEAAGLPSSRRGMDLFHRLRRTNISYCAQHSLALAQQQAGHSDPRLTQQRYIDPRIARTRSAVDVLPRPKF